MFKSNISKFIITLGTWLFFQSVAFSNSFSLEAGGLWQERNDVRIPSKTGKMVSFDEYDSGPFVHYRLEGNYQISESHGLRFVFAPLDLSVTGSETRNVNFNNIIFSANIPIKIDYKFNSYRLGYTYNLWSSNNNYFKIGFTGKIRQASIAFTQGILSTKYDNVGFVPLFYYGLKLGLLDRLYLYNDADFAWSPQGRAVDVTLKIRYKLTQGTHLGVGGRVLEGGADNDKVLTFSLIKYVLLDLHFVW